ncbi:RNB domain-containing protein [Mycena sanguinolenta]|uniref:RNB domain-containing protein n=1 Tax=Mycena sanguinolenta TaxID=230812 RepID=A0A8H7DIL9_9AGAR|nr:RNB domain-containing protein [Mycena sanguinolenta]
MQRCRAALVRVGKQKCARALSVSSSRHNRAAPTAAEFSAMSELAEKIVDTAALRHPPDGWIAPTTGDEKRLGRIIATQAPAPSNDKKDFDIFAEAQAVGLGDWLEEEDSSGEMFTPGTFVEMRRNEQATHAVVLGEMSKDNRRHVMALVSSGEVWDPLREDIMFSVPALVAPDLALRCSMLDIAVEESQLNARIKVLQNIRQIERAVEAATTDIIRSSVDVYSIVKSRDPNEWAATTVAEVARLFSSKPTLVTIFATHKYLMDRPEYFVAKHGYILSQAFDVRPASHIATLNAVSEWCRQPSGPIQGFAKRALPIMSANRRLRLQHRNDIPSQRPAKHSWTPEDISILTFLHQTLQPMRSVQRDPYSIGQSAIIHALDPTQTVDDHEVHTTLVDLGVYAPWQDVYSLRRSLELDQEDPQTSSKAKATEALVQRSLSAPPRRGPLGPEDFYASDPLDHLRHDFGDMPVYVIDDAYAQELDDGISVEAVSGEPDSYWLHVHIADPASTVPPAHILSQRAAKQSQSAYFIHRTWPLFPKSLMFSGRPGFTLAHQSENRVLAFSSKIDSNGDLVACVVRPGIARNFVKVTYDEVDLALTGEVMQRFYPFSVPPPPPPKREFSNRQLEDLRTLMMLRNRLAKRRLEKGIIEPNAEAAHLTNFIAPQNIDSPTMRPSEFRGFPEFSYFVTTSSDMARGSRGMVAEAMKLACRTASRWCVERGVDVIRRSASPMAGTPEQLEKLRALRDEEGFVDVALIAAGADGMPVAGYTLKPAAHWSVTVPEGEGYTRATSPLRRYSDLLIHYQIHASLLGKKLPFSRAYLYDYIKWLKHDDQLKKRTETLHQRFWVLMALKRWLEAPRADIPDPTAGLQAIIMRPYRVNTLTNELQSEVRIPSLGIAASLGNIGAREALHWELATSKTVKIDEIKLGVRPTLTVSAVK